MACGLAQSLPPSPDGEDEMDEEHLESILQWVIVILAALSASAIFAGVYCAWMWGTC